MPASVKDVLSAICSQVEPQDPIGNRDVYLLADVREANLAYELLFVYGFEVRILAGQTASKLQILVPESTDSTVAARLDAALACANTLKQIKGSMDGFVASPSGGVDDFSFTFAKTSGEGKQLTIYMHSTAATLAEKADNGFTPELATAAISSQAPVAAATTTPASKFAAKKEAAALEAGPEIARQYPFGMKSSARSKKTLYGRIKLRIKEYVNRIVKFLLNVLGANAQELLTVLAASTLIVMFAVLIRGLICRDVAAPENTAWICTATVDPDDDPLQNAILRNQQKQR